MDEEFNRRRARAEIKELSHANAAIKIQAHRHAVSITPRRIVIDYGPPQSPPNDWYANDAAVTEVFHALSATFPAGEAFFQDSVRQYEQQLRNDHPALWLDVVAFFKQEALHSAQHEKWNRVIEGEFGHPMADLERAVDVVMDVQKRYLDPLSQLACTVCFEHLTATFGQILLRSKDACLRRMRPPQRKLWTWHALEEIEHKAVAFDVYVAVGGGYMRRVLAMLWVTILFACTFGSIRIYLHWRRGVLFKPKTIVSMSYFGLIDPGFCTRFLWPYLLFFRPGFHPWETDDSELVKRYSDLLASDTAD